MFRQGSGINEPSATAQLFQCASQSLGESLLKSDAEIVCKPLQELLSAMRRLAVIPVATRVLRSDLMQMRQLRDGHFRAFAARVRGKTDICAFTIDCTCGLKVNYTNHMIRDTLLNGIADDEIRREILGSADVLTRAVNEIVALVESKEMARNAVPRPRSHMCQPFSAYMTQTTEHVVMQTHAGNPTIYLLAQNSCVVRSASDSFSSTKRGLVVGIPNLIPCVLNATGHRNTKVDPSPPESGLQTLEVTSPTDSQ